MEAKTKNIIHYLNTCGESPFVNWIIQLKDIRAKQIIEARIRRLSSGNYGEFKSVGEGILESRIAYGPGYRIYFAEVSESVLIILIAGGKYTQNEDINKTKKFWKEYK